MSRITNDNFEFVNKYGSDKMINKAIDSDYHSPELIMQRPGEISDSVFDKIYEKGLDEYDWSHIDMAKYPDNLKQHHIEKLLSDKTKGKDVVHRYLAEYAKLSDDQIHKIKNSGIEGVDERLVKNRFINSERIDNMLNDDYKLIKHAVDNPNLSRHHALKVLFPKNPAHENLDWQRSIVFSNDNLTQDDLHKAKDSTNDVLLRIHANKRIEHKRFKD